MSKLDRVTKSIETMRTAGIAPLRVRLSRSFAIAIKVEMMPEIRKHFINGRMTVHGIPWELDDNVRGFRVERD